MHHHRTPILATALVALLLVPMLGVLAAPEPAGAQIQEFVCNEGVLVGDQCRIVGPPPSCVSPALGTAPDCYVVVAGSIADCVRPYLLRGGVCVTGGTGRVTTCPPTGGPPATLIIPPTTTALTWRCEYTPPFVCPAGAVDVGGECRRPVPPACTDPFEFDQGECIRFVPADIVTIPGRVTLTYDAACGSDGRVGVVGIQTMTENGASVVAITINGSTSTSTRIDPGAPIDVQVLTNNSTDEITITGPTTAPTCTTPTPTTPPGNPTPTPAPSPTPTPTTDDDPVEPGVVLSASVEPGDCAAEGERSVVLSAALNPGSRRDRVQWSVDGSPVTDPMIPRTLNLGVAADGGPVRFEAVVIEPAGVEPFVETVTIDACVTPGEPSVEVGPCDADGLRELVLLSTTGDRVQWFVDGEPVGPAAPPGPLMGSVVADGGEHLVELRILAPAELAALSEIIVVEPCERGVGIAVDVGDCVADGRQAAITVTLNPEITGDLVQLTLDGVALGGPVAPGTQVVTAPADDAEHVATATLVQPDTSAAAMTSFTVESCPAEVVQLSATSLRQHGRSEVVLPPECQDASVQIPGVDQLVPVEMSGAGEAVFSTDSTTLDVGEHVATIDCSGTEVTVTMHVYRQIGGRRGAAQGITVATALGLTGFVLVGAARRRFLLRN